MRRIIRREVRQGHDHDRRITNLYRMVRKAAREEFYEDNDPTLNQFLTECFEASLKGKEDMEECEECGALEDEPCEHLAEKWQLEAERVRDEERENIGDHLRQLAKDRKAEERWERDHGIKP